MYGVWYLRVYNGGVYPGGERDNEAHLRAILWEERGTRRRI